MFATYEETIHWLHNLLSHGMKPGLARMEWMLDRLGHPERRLHSIHVAGTNGKGSTVSFLRHILQEGGYRVGAFISPYVVRFNERISVNGEEISDADLQKIANRVKPLVNELQKSELGSPSEFEVITVMGMIYFAEMAVPDYVLFEVGLGGRLDSTNVIHPMLSIITNIGFDHTELLGDRIEKIAAEKAGIIKPGVPVVTASTQPAVLEVIRKTCKEKNAKYYVLGEAFSFGGNTPTQTGEAFSFCSPFVKRENTQITLKGLHQIQNASVALMVIDYLRQYTALVLDEGDIREGLRKTSWPGRFEEVRRQPHIILDGAHNPAGIKSLVFTVKRHFPNQHIHILFAALEKKKIDEMLKLLPKIGDEITFTTFSFPRAASAKRLFEKSDFLEKSYDEDWRRALRHITEKQDDETTLIVMGSLYFISEVRGYLKCMFKKEDKKSRDI